jgi:hypothetical protein
VYWETFEFTWNGYEAFAQLAAAHQAYSLSTYDAAIGTGKDAWLVQLYAENLTNARP